jgi:hypothetical protein
MNKKFAHSLTLRCKSSDIISLFANVVFDTSGKFTVGVVYIGGKFPPAPATNLLPESLTLMVQLELRIIDKI